MPYLSIPWIEKLESSIVEINDLSCLTPVTIATTYPLWSITKSLTFRFRFSPPDMMYSSEGVLKIIEVCRIL